MNDVCFREQVTSFDECQALCFSKIGECVKYTFDPSYGVCYVCDGEGREGTSCDFQANDKPGVNLPCCTNDGPDRKLL